MNSLCQSGWRVKCILYIQSVFVLSPWTTKHVILVSNVLDWSESSHASRAIKGTTYNLVFWLTIFHTQTARGNNELCPFFSCSFQFINQPEYWTSFGWKEKSCIIKQVGRWQMMNIVISTHSQNVGRLGKMNCVLRR